MEGLVAQPARSSRASERNSALNGTGTSVVATGSTAASLARFCAGIMSSNVKRLRRRATIQSQRRRSDRQEDDWGAIKAVGGLAGNSGVGRRNDRCVCHRSRRQLKHAGRKRTDTHHTATCECSRLAAGISHSGMVVHRTGRFCVGRRLMIVIRMRHALMNKSGLTVHVSDMLDLRWTCQAMRQSAVCKGETDRRDEAKGIERNENARSLYPHDPGQLRQHPESALPSWRAPTIMARGTVRVPNRQDALGSQQREKDVSSHPHFAQRFRPARMHSRADMDESLPAA